MTSLKDAPTPITFQYIKKFLKEIHQDYGNHGLEHLIDPTDILETDEFAKRIVLLSPEEAAKICNKIWKLAYGEELIMYGIGSLYGTSDIQNTPELDKWRDTFEKLVDKEVVW